MKELNIQKLILMDCSDIAVLWRNNTGALKDSNGRLVRYGLCVGGADIIGIRKADGLFCCIEVKQPGKKPTPEQINFINVVRKFGGLAGVATNSEEARKIILGEGL